MVTEKVIDAEIVIIRGEFYSFSRICEAVQYDMGHELASGRLPDSYTKILQASLLDRDPVVTDWVCKAVEDFSNAA